MTSTTQRDPREDPSRGDTVRLGESLLEVRYAGKLRGVLAVVYLVCHDAHTVTLNQWRELFKGEDVR